MKTSFEKSKKVLEEKRKMVKTFTIIAMNFVQRLLNMINSLQIVGHINPNTTNLLTVSINLVEKEPNQRKEFYPFLVSIM